MDDKREQIRSVVEEKALHEETELTEKELRDVGEFLSNEGVQKVLAGLQMEMDGRRQELATMNLGEEAMEASKVQAKIQQLQQVLETFYDFADNGQESE